MAKKTLENKPYRFITKDFKGETEVLVLKGKGKISHIEERSDRGTGQVKIEITPPGGANAKPLRPEGAWFSLENAELVNYLRAAKEDQREVTYRIDIKRKPHIEKNIPFIDLYQSMDDAAEKTIRILALVDNIESTEAVTNPADDPVFGEVESMTISEMQNQRKTASPADTSNTAVNTANSLSAAQILNNLQALIKSGELSPYIIDNIAAQALTAGASVEQVINTLYSEGRTGNYQPASQPGRTFSVEAPRWEDYNSDGRLNLGSANVASGVSMESAVSRNILNGMEETNPANLKGFVEVVEYFTNLSFSICDYAQTKMYGAGSRVARKAESHTRVRGIFIDLLERFFYFPVTVKDGTLFINSSAEVDEWVKNVGGTIVQRFTAGITASQTHKKFGELRNELATLPLLDPSGIFKSEETPVAALTSPNVEPEEEESLYTPEAPEDLYEPPMALTEEAVPPPVAEAPASAESRLSTASDIINSFVPTEGIYDPEPVAEENVSGVIPSEEELQSNYELVTANVIKLPAEGYDGELASPEDIEMFKDLLNSLGFNFNEPSEMALIGKIIKFTFGNQYSKLQEIPSDLIGEFIDWYASNGPLAMNELRQLATEAFQQ